MTLQGLPRKKEKEVKCLYSMYVDDWDQFMLWFILTLDIDLTFALMCKVGKTSCLKRGRPKY